MKKAFIVGMVGMLLCVSGWAQQKENNGKVRKSIQMSIVQKPGSFVHLLSLFGLSKLEVQQALGLPSNTIGESGGDIELVYSGYSVIVRNGHFEELQFVSDMDNDFSYYRPIFPGITFNGKFNNEEKLTIEWLERFIGPYQSKKDYRYFNTLNGQTYNWLNGELSVTANKGAISSLLIKSQDAADLLKNAQQYPISLSNLAYFLGGDFITLDLLYELLGKPDTAVQNEELNFLLYPSKGFGFTTDISYNIITGLLLFAKNACIREGHDELPYGLSLDISKQEALKKLGKPSGVTSKGNFTYMLYDGKALILVYDEKSWELAWIQFVSSSKELLIKKD